MTQVTIIPFKTWLLLIAVGILIFLMNIDYTAVNLTLLPISKELGADINVLQWLLSAYVLVWGSLVVPAGRIADIYGKRNTLIVGLIIFMLGSCVVGMGYTPSTLIIGRIIQGLGASIFTAPCWAVIFTSAPPEKQGLVMGIVMFFSGAGLAVGPTLGGYLIEAWHWRWIYYINIPIGIVVIAILLTVAKNDKEEVTEKIDVVGTFLLASGLCLLVFSMNQIEAWGFDDYKIWATSCASVALLIIFFTRNSKLSHQMIPSYLLSNRSFIACFISVALVAMTFSAIMVLLSLYFQNAKGLSSYETGILFFAMTVSMGGLSPFGGVLVDKFGVRKPMILSLIILTAGVLITNFFGVDTKISVIICALFLMGIGLGGYFTAGNLAMMRSVSSEDVTIASGVYTMGMMIGNTISVVLSTSLLVLFGKEKVTTKLASYGSEITHTMWTFAHQSISKVMPSIDEVQSVFPEQSNNVLQALKLAFVESFVVNMSLVTILAFVSLIIVIRGVSDTPAAGANTSSAAPVL